MGYIYIYKGHLPRTEKMHQSFLITPENKILLETLGHGWKGNYEMDFMEKGFEDVNLIYLLQNRAQWWGLMNMI